MKIVLFVRSLGCGGAERQLVLLATHLARRHEVTILTFYSGQDFFHPKADANVKVIALEKSGRWDLAGFLGRFRTEIRRLAPDVIYGFMNTAGVLSLSARLIRPTPAIVWGIRSSNMELKRYGIVPRVLRWVEARLSGFADLAISNSETGRQEAIADGFRTTILVVPNGIDTARFIRDDAAGKIVRAAWRVPADAVVIGAVGRHDPMKGYETFLRAAAQYAQRNPGAYFVSIGDGPRPYSDGLKRLAEQLGVASRVTWAGQVADMVACYSAMDLFTSPSAFGEGFSNAIAEALACGLPCVATDVGDARAIVGDAGLVVPPNAPDALASAWQQVIAGPGFPNAEARARSRARIVDRFSDTLMANRTEDALVDVVAKQRGRREATALGTD